MGQPLLKCIGGHVKTLRVWSKPVIEAQQALAFFRKTWEALRGEVNGASCPVCLEEVSIFSTYILFCGHTLCADCAPHLQVRRCPVCRFGFQDLHREAVQLRDVTLHNNNNSIPEPQSTRAHWSSKLYLFVVT